jgi:threonine dehydrogenase-like Zn-dependent dehydrogenase
MKAVAITPQKPHSAAVVNLPKPRPPPGEVLLQVLEVGICGTDAEIDAGLYGEAPPGEPFLILGHEILGRLPDGKLAVPMVRRPCSGCAPCHAGVQDMCASGTFTERGIKGLHGGLCEWLSENPSMLVRVPDSARMFAVLLEPMSVVEKGLRHAILIQGRFNWSPRRALVLGAGPIGQLATLLLRLRGWEVTTLARKPRDSEKARIVDLSGATYHSVAEVPLPEFIAANPPFDLVFEATGSAEAAFESILALAPNGILCLSSVTGGDAAVPVPVSRINRELVLGNKVVFGTVNANRMDFEEGLRDLMAIDQAFPGTLARIMTRKISFSDTADMFEIQRAGIKTVFEISTA